VLANRGPQLPVQEFNLLNLQWPGKWVYTPLQHEDSWENPDRCISRPALVASR